MPRFPPWGGVTRPWRDGVGFGLRGSLYSGVSGVRINFKLFYFLLFLKFLISSTIALRLKLLGGYFSAIVFNLSSSEELSAEIPGVAAVADVLEVIVISARRQFHV